MTGLRLIDETCKANIRRSSELNVTIINLQVASPLNPLTVKVANDFAFAQTIRHITDEAGVDTDDDESRVSLNFK